MTMFFRALRCAAGLSAALGLLGCAGASSNFSSNAMVAPGAYAAYNCDQLALAARTLRTRRTELEQLMARASQGTGGEFISAVTYRTDYDYTNGQYNEVMASAASKNCASQSKWSSERSTF